MIYEYFNKPQSYKMCMRGTIVRCVLFLIVLTGLFNTISTDTSIRQLHILFRHGDRNPTETYANDPYKTHQWPEGWGHLTNLGKRQLYSLGRKFRRIYNSTIPDYNPNDVKLFSSYSVRCQMSAQALAAGLFPPRNEQIWNPDLLWQPVPVHYAPRAQDNTIVMKAKCPKYDKLVATLNQTAEIIELDRENAELYRFLTEQAGQPYDNIWQTELLYNTLEIEQMRNLSQPEWTKNVSMGRLWDIAARSLASFTETDYMKRMKGGVFLNQTIALMKNRSDETPFVYLYSGHDTSVVNIMRTLGHESPLKPGFGASIAFELHNDGKIAIYYRHDTESDFEKIIPRGCFVSICTLKQLETGLKDFLPQNWSEECKLDE